jgi:hypothetical protein
VQPSELTNGDAMTDKPDGTRRWGIIRWISGLLVLYVLSIGPVDRYLGEAMNPAIFMILYYPMIMLGIVFRPFGALLDWYCHLWG